MNVRKITYWRYLVIFLAFIFVFYPAANIYAQSYSFSLPEEYVDIYWNEDGTSSIDYLFVFINNPDAPPIEFVDVGIPNPNYDLNSVVAYINGIEIKDIEKSPYVVPGVAVNLGNNAIPPGQSGEVRVFIGRVRDVLYPDDQDDQYVSAVFGTSYFEPGTVTGSTDLTVRFHFPPSLKPEEPRWHEAPPGWPSEPQTGIDSEGRITYEWHNPGANGETLYTFGASFPAKYIPPQTIVKEPPPASSVASPLASLLACLTPAFVPFLCLSAFAAFIVVGIISYQRRKLQYLPPKIAIEGHGIKRGLTAVEAAILLEQPMDKILTMILFSVIKKNAAEVISRDPLKIKIVDPLPDDLHSYEIDFLAAFEEKDGAPRRKALQKAMVDLVKASAKK